MQKSAADSAQRPGRNQLHRRTVKGCRQGEAPFRRLQAVMANGFGANPNPILPEAPPQSYGRGHFGSGSASQHHRGSHSLELPPYTSIGPSSRGADMRSSSIDTAMELTRVRSAPFAYSPMSACRQSKSRSPFCRQPIAHSVSNKGLQRTRTCCCP